MDLYPYQREGVEHLLRRRCLLLADEMGLGKTVQVVVALRQLFEWQSIRRVLIVCPTSLTRLWRLEFRRWAPEIPVVLYEGGDRYGMLEGNAAVLVGSYESVTNDLRRKTQDGNIFFDAGLDVLVLDEAQRIKSESSFRGQILSRLVAPRRWAISGTPLENNAEELRSILRFLAPTEIDEVGEMLDWSSLLAYRDRYLLRRIKQDVGLQLPERTMSYVPIALSPEQAAEYDQKATTFHALLASPQPLSNAGELLATIQHLRRIAAMSSSGESAKLDFVAEEIGRLLRDSSKAKAVVFSSFARRVLPIVRERLAHFGALLLTGDLSAEDREVIQKRFIEDDSCRVMCASLRAAGVGYTWTVATHVYHMDLWWNPQVLRQAEDRVHRIGQRRNVFFRRLVAENTIDEAIAQLLTAKENIFDAVIEKRAGDAGHPDFLHDLVALIAMKQRDQTFGIAK